jgi:acyl-CoA reductase-like NAD-dependent aldehyde dehydrogenase
VAISKEVKINRCSPKYPDPATAQLIGTAPECDVEDVQLAIEAAVAAFSAFRSKTGRERSRMLKKWYDLVVSWRGTKRGGGRNKVYSFN